MIRSLVVFLILGGSVFAQPSQLNKASNLRLLTTEYLRIYFTGGFNQKLDPLAEAGDTFLQELESRWNVKLPEEKVKISVLSVAAKGPNHIDGPRRLTSYYDPIRKHIYLGIPGDYDEKPVVTALRHQLLHHFLNVNRPEPLPTFLEEGLAQYYGNPWRDQDQLLAIWAFQRPEGVAAFLLDADNFKGDEMYYGALLSRLFVQWLWENHPKAETEFVQGILLGKTNEELWESTITDVKPDDFPSVLLRFEQETYPRFKLIDMFKTADFWRIALGILISAWLWLRMIPAFFHARAGFVLMAAEGDGPQPLIEEKSLKGGLFGAPGAAKGIKPLTQAAPPAEELPPDLPPDLGRTETPPVFAGDSQLPPDFSHDLVSATADSDAGGSFDFLNFNDEPPPTDDIQDLEEDPSLPPQPPSVEDDVDFYEDIVEDVPARGGSTAKPVVMDPEPAFEIDDGPAAGEPQFVVDDAPAPVAAVSPPVPGENELVRIDDADDLEMTPPQQPKKKPIQRGKDLKVGVAATTTGGEAVLDLNLDGDSLDTTLDSETPVGMNADAPVDLDITGDSLDTTLDESEVVGMAPDLPSIEITGDSLDTGPQSQPIDLKTVPLAGGETVPLAGGETVPLTGGETVPLTGGETIPVPSMKTVPVSGKKFQPVPDFRTAPLPDMRTVPVEDLTPVPESPVEPLEDGDSVLDLEETSPGLNRIIVEDQNPVLDLEATARGINRIVETEEESVLDITLDEPEPKQAAPPAKKKPTKEELDQDLDSVFGSWGVD